MLITKIKKIRHLQPILPGSAEDLFPDAPMSVNFFGATTEGVPAEKGRALVEVTAPGTILDGIEDVLLTGFSPMPVKLLRLSETKPGVFEAELYFYQLFAAGFITGVGMVLEPGGVLIGFTPDEQSRLHDYDLQKVLFEQLAEVMMRSGKEKIKSLPLPCYWLKVQESGSAAASHFVGTPKTGLGEKVPYYLNRALYHVATLNTADFQTPELVRSKLSFYIDISDTENGWPETADRFKVFHYDQGTTQENPFAEELIESEKAIVFEKRLDLPGWNHSVLHQLKLTDRQQEEYEALLEVFRVITGVDDNAEYNKLFGYPDNVQDCVAYEAERIKEGLDYSDKIYKTAVNWQLLLQISPYCYPFHFFETFGDGTIYFMIKKEDLAKGNFDAVQVVVQNT